MNILNLFLLALQILFLILEIYFYFVEDDFKKSIICNGIILFIMIINLVI